MKKSILFFVAVALVTLIAACTNQPAATPPAPTAPGLEPPTTVPNTCITNNDCVRTGCSGNICQSNKQEPVFSTCEFLPEYECYNEVPCGCIQGQCQWSNESPYTGVLEKCLAEKQGQQAAERIDEQGVPIV